MRHFAGGLDADGWPVAWTTRIACPPFGGAQARRTEGIANMPYAIPHILVDYHPVDQGIPVSYWRSVGYSQNVFFAESLPRRTGRRGRKGSRGSCACRLLANVPRLQGGAGTGGR